MGDQGEPMEATMSDPRVEAAARAILELFSVPMALQEAGIARAYAQAAVDAIDAATPAPPTKTEPLAMPSSSQQQALREAVARALYEAVPNRSGLLRVPWDEASAIAQSGARYEFTLLADAAVGVVLDAVEAAIEQLQAPFAMSDLDHGYNKARADVLAVVDALRGGAA